MAHDVHHAILGYETTWRGELEIAAWEVASGGCAWNVLFWFNCLLAMLLVFVFCPIRIARAVCAGFGRRNLFGLSVDTMLASDVAELRQRMRLPNE